MNWDWFNHYSAWKIDWEVFGLITIILVSLVLLAYTLAGYGIFISFIKSGEILLVEEGKSFYRMIPNAPGYGVKDDKVAKIEDGAKKPFSILGIFWVGFYPFRKIHQYDFSWDKTVSKEEAEREEKKGGKIEETGFAGVILSHRSETVSSIRHKNSYPIIVKEVELAGQMKIDIFFNVIFEIVDPVFAVFVLSGNWISLATSAFRGIISDFVKGMELRRKKGELSSSKTVKNLFFEELEKETKFNAVVIKKAGIILKASGAIPFKVVYRDYAISGSDKSKEATEALKIAELNALAKVAEAEGDAAKIIKIKEAEAQGEAQIIRETKKAEAIGLWRILHSAHKHPQGGNIVMEQLRAERLKNFRGSTLVEGNSATPISAILPLDQGKKDDDKNVK